VEKYNQFFEEQGLWDSLKSDIKGFSKAQKQRKATEFFSNPKSLKIGAREIVHSALDKYDGDYKKAYDYLTTILKTETSEDTPERENVKDAIQVLVQAVRKVHNIRLDKKRSRGFFDDDDDEGLDEVDYKTGEFSRKTTQQIYNIAMQRNRRSKSLAAEYLKDLLNYDIKKGTSEYLKVFEVYKALIGKKQKTNEPDLPEKQTTKKQSKESPPVEVVAKTLDQIPQFASANEANKRYLLSAFDKLSKNKKRQFLLKVRENPNVNLFDLMHSIIRSP
jgi:hypothetical protein